MICWQLEATGFRGLQLMEINVATAGFQGGILFKSLMFNLQLWGEDVLVDAYFSSEQG